MTKQTSSLTVQVSQPYPIYFVEGLSTFIAETVQEKRLAIISNAVVAPLYAQDLADELKRQGKTVSTFNRIGPSQP
jgi:3-dehydroquinate synthetase